MARSTDVPHPTHADTPAAPLVPRRRRRLSPQQLGARVADGLRTALEGLEHGQVQPRLLKELTGLLGTYLRFERTTREQAGPPGHRFSRFSDRELTRYLAQQAPALVGWLLEDPAGRAALRDRPTELLDVLEAEPAPREGTEGREA